MDVGGGWGGGGGRGDVTRIRTCCGDTPKSLWENFAGFLKLLFDGSASYVILYCLSNLHIVWKKFTCSNFNQFHWQDGGKFGSNDHEEEVDFQRYFMHLEQMLRTMFLLRSITLSNLPNHWYEYQIHFLAFAMEHLAQAHLKCFSCSSFFSVTIDTFILL